MARRYSGDVEVRLVWSAARRRYDATVRDPNHRLTGHLDGAIGREPASPAAYDEAARRVIEDAMLRTRGKLLIERDGRRIAVSRMFQSPCPLEDDR